MLPDRKVTRVDPKILDRYVGQYQPASSTVVTITRDGEKLIMQQGEGDKRELLPESETNFFVKDAPRSVYSFVKDATGQVHFVITLEGREVWRATKVK